MNVMAESPVYQEILNQGRAEGLAEGEAKGRAEGEAKGRVEGEAKGRVQGLRAAVELGLEIRFGKEAKLLSPMLARCSLAELTRAAEAVKTVRSLKEFERAITRRRPPQVPVPPRRRSRE
jgi:predicted transposase YdaD